MGDPGGSTATIAHRMGRVPDPLQICQEGLWLDVAPRGRCREPSLRRRGAPDDPRAAARTGRLLAFGRHLGHQLGTDDVGRSGSPGAGKTAVLTDWLTHHSGAVAWLSCDPTDADPIRFWSVGWRKPSNVSVPGAGGDALQNTWRNMVTRPPTWRPRLANDCEFAPDLVIVVDDFHHARPAPAVFSAFVRSLPAGVRLVLLIGRDPSFPVGRLRVQGRLLERRDAGCLRFSVGEACELFANLGIEIAEDDLGRLCTLTEGWAAGLQLAALSLAARPDADGLVQTFAASDRGVSDLLLNEVIDLQTPDVADFLMATSVLESFDATICDAVTGRNDSAELLGRLHQNHLFVIALDWGAGWYPLSPPLLRIPPGQAGATSRQRYRDAHADAARAFAAVGDSLTAVEHAMKADDVAGALDLLNGVAHRDRRLRESFWSRI